MQDLLYNIGQTLQVFWQEFTKWYIIILTLTFSFSLGYFKCALLNKKIITKAKKSGGVNFGEQASIEITDKTTTHMWFFGIAMFLTLGGAIALLIWGLV